MKKKILLISFLFSVLIISAYFFISGLNLFGFSNQNNSIMFKETKIDNDQVEVKVLANNLKDEILGAAFNIEYDNENLSYNNFSPGEFFEQGGEPIYLCSPKKNKPGLIVCGITLKRGDKLQKGSGTLISLYFKIKSNNWDDFMFENTSVSPKD
jgi:hypothetical protein